jgi:DNA-binding XRE family transcriptional regulator
MTTISHNLKRLREKNTNYDQTQMAILLGVKQNTYSTWESGEVDVKSEYVPKIAELLNVEIKDLFETKSNRLSIKQTITDNKDNSVNGLVFVLTDEKSVQELVKVLKKNIDK